MFRIRLICAAAIAVFMIGGMTGTFYPVKVFDVQFSAVFQRNLTAFSWGAALALAGVLIVTAVFGRVYCSTVCPLGLFQELLTIVFRRKQKPQKNRALKYFVAAAAFGATIGGGAALGRKAFAKVKNVLLPAGAKNAQRLANRCLNCNLCVQNCPMKILKKADENFPAVHLDLSKGFCAFDCHKCGDVCPSGAIERLPRSGNHD